MKKGTKYKKNKNQKTKYIRLFLINRINFSPKYNSFKSIKNSLKVLNDINCHLLDESRQFGKGENLLGLTAFKIIAAFIYLIKLFL